MSTKKTPLIKGRYAVSIRRLAEATDMIIRIIYQDAKHDMVKPFLSIHSLNRARLKSSCVRLAV
jgi:hypothetical protein